MPVGPEAQKKKKKISTKQARPEAGPVCIKDHTQEKRILGVNTESGAGGGGVNQQTVQFLGTVPEQGLQSWKKMFGFNHGKPPNPHPN